MSPSSDAAVSHLRRIRPYDGWGVETKNQQSSDGLIRLTRRNVPVTDSFFLDIHLDENTMIVVGILTGARRTDGTVQAQKLVDKDGKLLGNTVQLISISNYHHQRPTSTGSSRAPSTRSSTTGAPRTTTTGSSTSTSRTTTTETTGEFSNEQNQDIIKYGSAAVLIAVAIRVISTSLSSLIILVGLPAAFLYLLSTCPDVESFDAKKELKRVLRGHHLPNSHPEKPRGFFEQTLARIQATVATELATLPGYAVRMESFIGGAIVLAVVNVPAVDITYYWLGAANRWFFIYGSPNNRPGPTS